MMVGIVGLICTEPQHQATAALRKMHQCLMHSRSYASGTYVNAQLGLYVGWASHPGSSSDCMPVWNETRDVCLIFSGEDFTDQSDVEHLQARGHDFHAGDCSYLVHLYEEMGSKFTERLNGWFSGLIVDLRKQAVILFNDRYGLGRIYLHQKPEKFYFSSEAKSLLKVLPELRRFDLTSLGEVFSCGSVLQNRTLFRGMDLLPGASRWTFTGPATAKKELYFTPSLWEAQPLFTDAARYYQRLTETFQHLIKRYLRSRQPLGISLTGGLDGRMILAWARSRPGELPAYTFAGTYRDCVDVTLARTIAKLCQQSHQTISVGPEFLRQFQSLAEKAVYISDGTMDVTGSVELYVNRIARSIAPVRLTGNYGSEVMRGSVAFNPRGLDETLLEPAFAQLVRTAKNTYGSEQHSHPLSFIAFKQVPWHHYSRLAVERSQLTVRSPYLDNDLVALLYQAPVGFLNSKEASLRLIADGNPELAKLPTDRGLLYQPVPCITACRHLYQEFMFKAEYAYDYGMPQWLAKTNDLLAPLRIENLFLGRHKFYHFRAWYRGTLSSYVKDILLDPRSRARPYVSGKRLCEIVEQHTRGHGNYTREIHRLLTTELIQRQLIEMEGSE